MKEDMQKETTLREKAENTALKAVRVFDRMDIQKLIGILIQIGYVTVAGATALFKFIAGTLAVLGDVLGVLKPVLGGVAELHAAYAAFRDKKTNLSEKDKKKPFYFQVILYMLYKRELWFRIFNIACLSIATIGILLPLLTGVASAVGLGAAMTFIAPAIPFIAPVAMLFFAASFSARWACVGAFSVFERYKINKEFKKVYVTDIDAAKEATEKVNKLINKIGLKDKGVQNSAALLMNQEYLGKETKKSLEGFIKSKDKSKPNESDLKVLNEHLKNQQRLVKNLETLISDLKTQQPNISGFFKKRKTNNLIRDLEKTKKNVDEQAGFLQKALASEKKDAKKITAAIINKKALNDKLFHNSVTGFESVGYSIAGFFGFVSAALTLSAVATVAASASGVGAAVPAALGIAAGVAFGISAVFSVGTLAISKAVLPLGRFMINFIKDKIEKKNDISVENKIDNNIELKDVNVLNIKAEISEESQQKIQNMLDIQDIQREQLKNETTDNRSEKNHEKTKLENKKTLTQVKKQETKSYYPPNGITEKLQNKINQEIKKEEFNLGTNKKVSGKIQEKIQELEKSVNQKKFQQPFRKPSLLTEKIGGNKKNNLPPVISSR
jgi:hypothetical protein